MQSKSFQSLTDQVVEALRAGMLSGRWRETLPGRDRLANELGVSHGTVEAAMRRLAKAGWLVSQGGGRRRRIALPDGREPMPQDFRVRVLAYDAESRKLPHTLNLLDRLRRAGMAANLAVKTQADLGMDATRLAKFVSRTSADAWVVISGSHEVLEWFASQPIPTMAMFGRFGSLPMAGTGPTMIPVLKTAIRRLIELGHTRVVMMARKERRVPRPGRFERIFLEELAEHGIRPGAYNLPDWEDTPEGFIAGLDQLWQFTPPTALFFQEARLYAAAHMHLAGRGIQIPRDVSLITTDYHSCLGWCRPKVSCFGWDEDKVVKRVVRWASNIAAGKEDRRQVVFEGDFIEGGTLGPAMI